MAIRNVEFLDDRIRVHYQFSQPEGYPNNSILNIPYGHVTRFPLLPHGHIGEELIVKPHATTLVFVPQSIVYEKTEGTDRFWYYMIFRKDNKDSEPKKEPELTQLL